MSWPPEFPRGKQPFQDGAGESSQSGSSYELNGTHKTQEGLSKENFLELLSGKNDGSRYSAHLAELGAAVKSLTSSQGAPRQFERSSAQSDGLGPSEEIRVRSGRNFENNNGQSSTSRPNEERPSSNMQSYPPTNTMGGGLAPVDESDIPQALRTPNRAPQSRNFTNDSSMRYPFDDSDEEEDEEVGPLAFLLNTPPPSETVSPLQSSIITPFTTPTRGQVGSSGSPVLQRSTGNSFRDDKIRQSTLDGTPPHFVQNDRSQIRQATLNGTLHALAENGLAQNGSADNAPLQIYWSMPRWNGFAQNTFAQDSRTQIHQSTLNGMSDDPLNGMPNNILNGMPDDFAENDFAQNDRSQTPTTPTRAPKRRPPPIQTTFGGLFTADEQPQRSSGSSIKLARLLGDEVLSPASPGGVVSPAKSPEQVAKEHAKLVSGLPTTDEEKRKGLSGRMTDGVIKIAKKLFKPAM